MKKIRKYYPLRKIVREFTIKTNDGIYTLYRPMEELECGHIVRQKTDIYGTTNAYKRRCKECGSLNERLLDVSGGIASSQASQADDGTKEGLESNE